MSIKMSVALRNARANIVEETMSGYPRLKFYSGPPPASCADPATGTLLATITCPFDWMSAASGGVVAKLGTWATAAVAAGTIGHFRLYDYYLTTCHMQGLVTATGDGGDMTVNTTTIAIGQNITVTAFEWTEGQA